MVCDSHNEKYPSWNCQIRCPTNSQISMVGSQLHYRIFLRLSNSFLFAFTCFFRSCHRLATHFELKFIGVRWSDQIFSARWPSGPLIEQCVILIFSVVPDRGTLSIDNCFDKYYSGDWMWKEMSPWIPTFVEMAPSGVQISWTLWQILQLFLLRQTGWIDFSPEHTIIFIEGGRGRSGWRSNRSRSGRWSEEWRIWKIRGDWNHSRTLDLSILKLTSVI